jgi:hypothetical protein
MKKLTSLNTGIGTAVIAMFLIALTLTACPPDDNNNNQQQQEQAQDWPAESLSLFGGKSSLTIQRSSAVSGT